MRPDDGAVDHLQAGLDVIGIVQRLQYRVPQAADRPTAELPIDRTPLAEVLRQVTPRRARPCDPEHAVQQKPMIAAWPPTLGASLCHEGLEERPFLIRHQPTKHAALRKEQR
jgi:hypothetical protein